MSIDINNSYPSNVLNTPLKLSWIQAILNLFDAAKGVGGGQEKKLTFNSYHNLYTYLIRSEFYSDPWTKSNPDQSEKMEKWIHFHLRGPLAPFLMHLVH